MVENGFEYKENTYDKKAIRGATGDAQNGYERMSQVQEKYMVVVHKPDTQVQHNFSASGWESRSRHAANHAPYADKAPAGSTYKRGGHTYIRRSPSTGEYYNYLTACGKNVRMDPDASGEGRAVPFDSRLVTCKACQRKLK